MDNPKKKSRNVKIITFSWNLSKKYLLKGLLLKTVKATN